MTLEEMLKGIDEFFEEYTPESFCKMLEDDFDVKFKDEKVDTVERGFIDNAQKRKRSGHLPK